MTKDAPKVAILATDGFEKSELFSPKRFLEEAGFDVTVISLESGEIKSWDEDDWGEPVSVDKVLSDAKIDDFDALVLPGGQINPDLLRNTPEAVEFVKSAAKAEKPIAAICHAPWILVEAGLAKGRRMTSFKSMSTDVKNAGADWVDQEVAVDGNIITSRNPDDLDAFNKAIAEAIGITA